MTDVDVPPAPPRKRRQLEAADARHLAIWANDEDLPPSARRRAQDERDRRKRTPSGMTVLVLEGEGGATPEQAAAVAGMVAGVREVWHPFASKALHRSVRDAAPVLVVDDGELDSAVAAVDRVIGLPNRSTMPERKEEGVWRLLRRAKDRGTDAIVVWPDGSTLTGRW